MGEEIRSCGEERLPEAHVGLRVVVVGVRLRNFELARARVSARAAVARSGNAPAPTAASSAAPYAGPSSRFTVVTGKP